MDILVTKPTREEIERKIVLSGDKRRRYLAKIEFQVESSYFLGQIQAVDMLLESGKIAYLRRQSPGEGICKDCLYSLEIDGFATATDAESKGEVAVQSLLFLAVSCNFGIRLLYGGHHSVSIIDKTYRQDRGIANFFNVQSHIGWSGEVVASELVEGMKGNIREKHILLSMEIYVSAMIQQSESSRFLATVSAFEPLAQQESLGEDVCRFVENASALLREDKQISDDLRSSLQNRVNHLKRESVRQALIRLCSKWFPGQSQAKRDIDRLYALRSEIIHHGTLGDLDVRLGDQCQVAAQYLREIYQVELGRPFRKPPRPEEPKLLDN